MLELKDLYKTFNPGTINAKTALSGLSVTLNDGDFVTVSLRGACANCYSSRTTLKEYVEKKLREQVAESLIVEEDK